MTHLTELWLSDNHLDHVPAHLTSLTSLRLLAAEGNGLAEVDPAIGQMTQLQHLLLGRNRLTRLPSELATLRRLKALSLEKNHFTRFPEPVLSMTRLQRLNLASNQLEAFPQSLRALRFLSEVCFDFNAALGPDLPDTRYPLEVFSVKGTRVDEVTVRLKLEESYTSAYDPEDLATEARDLLKRRAKHSFR